MPGADFSHMEPGMGGCGQVIRVPGGQLPHPQAHGLTEFCCVPCRAWAARPGQGGERRKGV